ncbi:MAG: hypothetical protein NVSMB2_11510 [Chloroflexota bacterium]
MACAAIGGAAPVSAATCLPGTFYVTQRFSQGVAKVTVDAACTATVQNNWVNTPAQGPDSVVFAPNGDLLISNTDQQVIAEVNPTTGAVVRSQVNSSSLIYNVADLAIQPGANVLFAVEWSTSTLARIDLTTGVTTFITSGLANLGGLTFNADGTRLFVSSHNGQIGEIDPVTGTLIRSVITGGGGFPDGMAFDPNTGKVYVTGCPNGVCQVNIGTTLSPTLSIDTQLTAVNGDGIAADGNGHLLVVNGFNNLWNLDIKTDTAFLEASGISYADDVAPIVGAGAPPVGATPELDSVLLFGSGLLGAGSYLKLRRRARA